MSESDYIFMGIIIGLCFLAATVTSCERERNKTGKISQCIETAAQDPIECRAAYYGQEK